eukprot:2349587-Prymnesium_polylepis.1
MYTVDLSNATGSWGSAHADGRCAGEPGLEWLSEIASLSRSHLSKHSRILKSTPAQCRSCAKRLGRSLPDDCLSELLTENVVHLKVKCVCLAAELRSVRSVSLLVVDAEVRGAPACARARALAKPHSDLAVAPANRATQGHDVDVLRQYPWSTVRTSRVVFESLHLSRFAYSQAAALLENHGFTNVQGGGRDFLDVWHHANSSDRIAPAALLCAPFGHGVEVGLPSRRDGRTGYCAPTRDGDAGDCSAGWGGSWALGPGFCTAAHCVSRCRQCAKCHFISFSLEHLECSWFSACSTLALRLDLGGHTYVTWPVGAMNDSAG